MKHLLRNLPIDGDVALTVASRLAMLACGLVASIVTARMLGPAGRGEYFVAVVYVATLVQFGNLGLQSSNVYVLAHDRSALRGLLSNSLWVSLSVGLALAAALMVWQNVVPGNSTMSSGARWLCVLLAPSSMFVLLGGSLLISLRKMKLYNCLQMLGSLLQVLLLGFATFASGTVEACLAATVASSTIVAAATFMALGRHCPGSWRFSLALFRKGLRYAGKAYLVCLLGFLLLRVNVLLLESVSDAVQVGCYSIAAQVADMLWIFPTSVSLVLFPRLVGAGDASWPEARRQLLLVAAVMLPGCLLAAVCLPTIVKALLGPAFLPAVKMFWWLTPGIFFHALSSVVSQYHAARGMPKVLIYLWSAALLVLLACGALLIPRFGGAGAAAAFSLASGVIFLSLLALAVQSNAVVAAAARHGQRATESPGPHLRTAGARSRH